MLGLLQMKSEVSFFFLSSVFVPTVFTAFLKFAEV